MRVKKIRNKLITLVSVLFIMNTTNTYAISDSVTTKRLGGSSRFETAVEISKEFVTKSNKKVNSVILCTAFEYADSVSVTPFAIYTNSPILLTRVDSLPIQTKNRINEMNVDKVYVIGGTGAISDNVVNELKDMGVSIERIGGINRFDTNIKILNKIPSKNLGDNVHIVDGYDPYTGFSLSVNTINHNSTNNNIVVNPIILENGYNTADNYKIYSYLKPKVGSTNLTVFYTNNNIADFNENYSSKRLHGPNTCKEALTFVVLNNNLYFKDNYNKNKNVIFTTAMGYADVMCAGPLSAITYTPIIYISPKVNNCFDLSFPTYGRNFDELVDMYKDAEHIYYIGGEAAVKDKTENIFRRLNIVEKGILPKPLTNEEVLYWVYNKYYSQYKEVGLQDVGLYTSNLSLKLKTQNPNSYLYIETLYSPMDIPNKEYRLENHEYAYVRVTSENPRNTAGLERLTIDKLTGEVFSSVTGELNK